MANVVINILGTKTYYNDADQYHREDGPAFIRPNGTKWWYVHGAQSSTTQPCDMNANGKMVWYLNNATGNRNGPSVDSPNGKKYWYENGERTWPKL